jgi:hypothetical protein
MFEQKLHALAVAAAEKARIPDIDKLARRGRTRRLRRRAATGVAAVVTVAVAIAVALTVSGVPHSARPVNPGPTTSTTHPDPRQTEAPSRAYLLHHPVLLVHQADARVVDVSYADPDHAAAVWEVCSVADSEGICPDVLTWTADGWRTSRATVVSDKLEIYALHNGSVVLAEGGPNVFLVSPDGSRRVLTLVPQATPARPSNDLINIPSLDHTNPVGMLDTATDTLYRPLVPPKSHCLLDDQWDSAGTLWEFNCDANPPGLTWTSDLGRTWSTHPTGNHPILGLAVTAGKAAVLLGTGGRLHELDGLDITTDEGRTWRHVVVPSGMVPAIPPAVLEPYFITTTAQGQLFLDNGATLWKANQDWTSFTPIRRGHLTAADITTADGVLCATSDNLVSVSNDNGATWRTLIPRPRL